MFAEGAAVGFGLLLIFIKCDWLWKLRLLSNPVKVDVAVFILLTAVHWGTFSGVMVAAIGALVCSVVLSIGKWLFGHVEAGSYVPGVFNVSSKL